MKNAQIFINVTLSIGVILISVVNFQQTTEIARLKKVQQAQAEAVIAMANLLKGNLEKEEAPPAPAFDPDSIPITEDTSKVSA